MCFFVWGSELGLGFVVGRRLLDEGHGVGFLTGSEDLLPNLTKNELNSVLGNVWHAAVQQQIAKADAIIDVETPFTFPRKRVHVPRLRRPLPLRKARTGSGKTLIVTGHAAILADTGPVPLDESTRLRPLAAFAWLPWLEKEILNLRGVRGMAIRPAWLVHGGKPSRLPLSNGAWVKLARRFRRSKYIGSGENCYSAVHFDDLAELYCVALKKSVSGTILHAASENISMMELAAAIHRGYRFKADPSSSPLQAARRFVPVADRLILSHALSGDRARSLGWTTSRSSVLKEVERNAREDALVSRLKLPRTECKEK